MVFVSEAIDYRNDVELDHLDSIDYDHEKIPHEHVNHRSPSKENSRSDKTLLITHFPSSAFTASAASR